MNYKNASWRPGDQPVYVSAIRRASELLGWRPSTSIRAGVTRLNEWVRANLDVFAEVVQS